MTIFDDPLLGQIADINPVPVVDAHAASSSEAISVRDTILAHDLRPTGTRGRFRRPRKRYAVGSGILGVLAAGGVAVAVGLTPPGVTRAIHSVSPSGAKVTDVRMLVEHVSTNGIRDQIWLARNSAGQDCHDDRTVAPNGHEDGAVGCASNSLQYPQPPGDEFTGGLSAAGRPWPSLTYQVIAHTTLAAITRIDLVYPNGESYALTLNPSNGWAIGVVPPKVTTLPSTLVGRNEHGSVVAEKQLPPTTG